ncbi:MAG TPA: hypothetical protein VGF24_24770 [Vicinamibacterales bacterium]|jgi:hypothetical protein
MNATRHQSTADISRPKSDPQTPDTADRLTEFWSIRVPRWLDPWSPLLADAIADGAWTAVWRHVTAFAPCVALAVGFFVPLFWPDMRMIYTESFWFMALVIGGAILSGPVGVMLLFGYVAGDLLGGRYRVGLSYFRPDAELLFRPFGSRLIGYLLLSLPAYKLPIWAQRVSSRFVLRFPGRGTLPSAALIVSSYAVACALLVFLWCQAMVVLVRPIFTWLGETPTVQAVQPVQNSGKWLVAIAVIAALFRTFLTSIALRSPRMRILERIQIQRRATRHHRGLLVRRVPIVLRTALAAATITLIMAGTYENWFDALLVLTVTTVLASVNAGLIGGFPAVWIRITHQVPELVRLVAAATVGYVVASPILTATWRTTSSLRPVLLGSLLTVILYYLLFPQRLSVSDDKRGMPA